MNSFLHVVQVSTNMELGATLLSKMVLQASHKGATKEVAARIDALIRIRSAIEERGVVYGDVVKVKACYGSRQGREDGVDGGCLKLVWTSGLES